MPASNELSNFYYKIPFFTRAWMTATIILSLIVKVGFVSAYSLVLHYYPLFYRIQLWRVLTSLFFYPITPQTGFRFLILLFFLYNYSSRLEESPTYSHHPGDYFYLLIFCWFIHICIALCFNIFLLFELMVYSVLYIWCQQNADVVVSFWFGMQFKAAYLPWVMLLFNLILQGEVKSEIIGILVGHLYVYLKFIHPSQMNMPSLLSTPTFIHNFFPSSNVRTGGFYAYTPKEEKQPSSSKSFPNAWRNKGHTLGSS